jgi:hypothetical protein
MESSYQEIFFSTSNLLRFDLAIAQHLNAIARLGNAIPLDFATAFDIVPHSALLAKLVSFGIQDQQLGWIRGSSETGFNSPPTQMRYKVQGSVIGPLLLTLMINNFPPQLRTLQIYFIRRSYQSGVQSFVTSGLCTYKHTDLDAIELWATYNGLQFSLPKCQCFCI